MGARMHQPVSRMEGSPFWWPQLHAAASESRTKTSPQAHAVAAAVEMVALGACMHPISQAGQPHHMGGYHAAAAAAATMR